MYGHALTQGRQYEVIDSDVGRRLFRVHADNRRLSWFPIDLFDFWNAPAPTLAEWHFDDTITNEAEMTHLPEVNFVLHDGTHRWSFLATPDALQRLLIKPHAEPGICAAHMIVVKDYKMETVDRMLKHLDWWGELQEASKPLEVTPEDAE